MLIRVERSGVEISGRYGGDADKTWHDRRRQAIRIATVAQDPIEA
jgi:hypothetical protein